mmetsp:Transcript_38499/g.62388  ORF Transcript_38499/g.62388 Transcript_38499/m.62388 type:complete len:352 (+) Transcript_38499:444-1499(+)
MSSLLLTKAFKKRFKQKTLGTKAKWVDQREESWRAIPRRPIFYAKCILYLLEQPKFLYYVLYLIFAIIGAVTGINSFFAYHLLDYIVRSRLAQLILETVSSNIMSIAVVIIMGCIAMYIFSLFAFIFYGPDLSDYCTSIGKCLYFSLLLGWHDGNALPDDGTLTSTQYWDEGTGVTIGTFILLVTYYLTIGLLLTNVVTSIIVDSFAAKREGMKLVMEDMQGKCTICGFERSVLDREGNGFENHVQHDHNLWHYIYFFVHLNCKNPDDYTGTESIIAEQVSHKSWDWIPANRALVLEEAVKEVETADDLKNGQERDVAQQMQDLRTQVQSLSASLRQLMQQQQTLPGTGVT